MSRADRHITGGYGASASTRNETQSFTAAACRSASLEWAASGNPVHEAAAPLLESWAVNAEARAAASERETLPDQMEMFNVW